MKKLPSKAELREELESHVADYMDRGGEVLEIPQGVSGHEPGADVVPSSYQFSGEPRTERTYVPEVVAAIEARRAQPPKPIRSKRKTTPRKQFIYDDFGEPIRWFWVED